MTGSEASDPESTSTLDLALQIVDGEPLPTSAPADGAPEQGVPLSGLRRLEQLRAAFAKVSKSAEPDPEGPQLFRWGPLIVREQIGEGATSRIYRAYEPPLDRDVALKLIRDRPGDGATDRPGISPATRRRLLDEARLHAQVRHPNVATVFGAEEHDGRLGMWTELIEGRSLADIVRSDGPLGAGEIVSIGLDLCRALAAVHARQLLHGDLKAANVMREHGGRIVLMDFGAGRQVRPDGTNTTLSGTPIAVAPELLLGEEPSPGSDLYSLGVLLYFLATGRYPVEGESLEEIVDSHSEGRRTHLVDRRPDLAPGLVRVIETAIDPDGDRRFKAVGALEKELRGCLDAPLTPTEVGRRAPRRPLFVACLVVLLMLAAWWSLRTASEEDRAQRRVPGELARLTLAEGNHGSPTFSVDRAMVAFVSDASGTDQVWVQPRTGGPALQVTDGAAVSHPTWTPSGEIAFSRLADGIWAVPALGGTPRRITDDGVHPSFSADGSRMIFEAERRLWLYEFENGNGPSPIESVPTRLLDLGAFDADLAPDGTRLVYFMASSGPRGDLWIADVDGSAPPQRLTQDDVEAGAPDFSPDGRTIVFWSDRDGTRSLWSIPTSGGEPMALTSGPGAETEPAHSATGDRIAFTSTRDRWRLQVFDPRTGGERTLIDRGTSIILPRVSPVDGRIAFFHRVGRGAHVFTVDAAGEQMRQLTTGDGLHIHPTWAADGRSILFYRLGAEPALLRMGADGGPPDPIAQGWTPGNQRDAVLAPGARRLAYLDQGVDHGDTKILDLETREVIELPEPHLHGIRWMPTGDEVVGWTHEGTVAACPVDGSACRTLTRGRRPVPSPGQNRLFFHRPTEDPTRWELWSLELDGDSEPRRLFTMGSLSPLTPTFDVTPTGEIVWVHFEEGQREVWQLELVAADSP